MTAPWPMVPLGEIAEPVSRPIAVQPGTAYRTIGVKWWGQGAYERTTIDGSQTAAKTLSRVRADDLIINKIWVRHGSTAVAGAEVDGCAASGEFPTFELARDRVAPRWLHWYTQTATFWTKCDALSQGTSGKNRIKPELFLTITLPLPPLAEQRRIVAKIDQLAAKIAEARGLRANTVEAGHAILPAALFRIAESLGVLGALRDVLASKPRNGWSARCDNADAGTAILSLSAVTGHRYDSSAFKRTSLPTDPQAHYWLRPGDLLITRSNTPDLVGHVAVYDGAPAPCIYPDLMMRLDVDERRAYKRFVWYWLQSPPARSYIAENATGTSPTMKKVAQGTVMSIPYPSHLTLAQQRCIVAYLDDLQPKVDRLKALQAQTAAELDALLPAILDQAFKGEL